MRISPRARWLSIAAVVMLVASVGTWAGTSGVASAKKVETVTKFYGAEHWSLLGGLETVGKGSVSCPTGGGQWPTRMWLDVPDGARITKVTVYNLDLDATYRMSFYVARNHVGYAFGDPIDGIPVISSDENAPKNFNGEQASVIDLTTTRVVIDGAKHEYGVGVEWEACGTTFNGPGYPPDFPSLTVDGVSVEYVPAA